jgi:1,2-diacylglycerol 3-beta-galactosyltransferase
MPPTNGSPTRVLLLFSDTGGGHRSAAEAIMEAWRAEHPGRVEVDLVDLFEQYAPFPFSWARPTYPVMVRYFTHVYAATFYASDGPRLSWLIARSSYGYVRPYLRRMLRNHPADLIVSVHPLFNHWMSWLRRELPRRIPYVTVVTDLCSGHAAWFYPDVDLLIVPTEEARDRAVRLGVSPQRLLVRGLPVARKFTTNPWTTQDRPRVRRQLGLGPDGRTVLLVGGGEGMGPIERMARAIDAALPDTRPPAQLVVITGRNAALRARLQAHTWRRPFRAEGFVTNMPDWMAAADVLVTKAGPGSITEGLISGLPLVLMGKVPGQEDGNVDYVTSKGVGVWRPEPLQAAAQLREWFTPGNPALAEMAERARRLAYPDAASAIAADILQVAACHAATRPLSA